MPAPDEGSPLFGTRARTEPGSKPFGSGALHSCPGKSVAHSFTPYLRRRHAAGNASWSVVLGADPTGTCSVVLALCRLAANIASIVTGEEMFKTWTSFDGCQRNRQRVCIARYGPESVGNSDRSATPPIARRRHSTAERKQSGIKVFNEAGSGFETQLRSAHLA